MKESQWPDERFARHLTSEGIPNDQQDLFSLFAMLPDTIYLNGESYLLSLYREGRWNASYSSRSGRVLHLETGRSMADAVARLTVYLLETGHVKKGDAA